MSNKNGNTSFFNVLDAVRHLLFVLVFVSAVPAVRGASRPPGELFRSPAAASPSHGGWKAVVGAGAALTAASGLVGWKFYRQRQEYNRQEQERIKKLTEQLVAQESLADPERIEYLVRHGAKVNGGLPPDGRRPLFVALDKASPEVVLRLIKLGADIHDTTALGKTPLLHVCLNNDEPDTLAKVNILLDAGADANKGRNNGTTPLMVSAEQGHHAVVDRLLRANALLEAKDNGGHTALMFAASANNVPMVMHLLQAGADPYTQDKDGRTAITYTRDDTIMRLLLGGFVQHVAEHRGNLGASPLWFAATLDEEDALRAITIFLDAGADVNKPDRMGSTPLMVSALNGSVAVVDRLLRAHAGLEAKDDEGRTALMCAALGNEIETARRLLDAGADPHAHDKQGKTAIDFAEDAEIVELLKARGAPPQVIKTRQVEENKKKAIESINELMQEAATLDDAKKAVILNQYHEISALRDALRQDPQRLGYSDYEAMLTAFIVRNKQEMLAFDERILERIKNNIELLDMAAIPEVMLNLVIQKLGSIRDALHALLSKKRAMVQEEVSGRECELCGEPESVDSPLGRICKNETCAKHLLCMPCYTRVMEDKRPPECPWCRSNDLYIPFEQVVPPVVEQEAVVVQEPAVEPQPQQPGFMDRARSWLYGTK